MKKVYIAGKITGESNFKEIFKRAENKFIRQGVIVMNPAELPSGFDYEDYMKVCFAMIDVCDGVHFLSNWQDSEGAKREYNYALATKKTLSFGM